MNRIGGFCVVLALLIAPPASLRAQRCAGAAAFADGNLRASAATSAAKNTRYDDLGLAIGRDHGLFASGGVERVTFKYSDVTQDIFNASVGYQLRIGTRVHLCPKLNAGRSTVTWFDKHDHVDYWSNSVGVSTALGVTAWSSSTFDFVPAAELAYSVISARLQEAASGIEQESRGSMRAGNLALSAGLVLRKVFTVSPFVSMSVGTPGTAKRFGASVSISFGPK